MNNFQIIDNINLIVDNDVIDDSYFLDNDDIETAVLNNVKRIGSGALSFCSNLKSVIISSDNDVIIEDNAFKNCNYLQQVDFKCKVKSIGKSCFFECNQLQNLIGISCDEFGDQAFDGCKMLNTIDLGKSTIIPNKLLYRCENLTSVKIPNTVTRIESCAFAECKSLKDIFIPRSVKYIGDECFYRNFNLQKIHFENVKNILFGNNVFIDDYKLKTIIIDNKENKSFTDNIFDLQELNVKNDNDINELSSRASIQAMEFSHTQLSCINLPNSISSLNYKSFYYNEILESVFFPESLINIDDYSFYKCRSLKNINIPNSVEKIGNHAFDKCVSLKSITFSSKMTVIPKFMCYGCTSLKSIEIPSNIKIISEYAFSNCTELSSIKFDSNDISICQYAFKDCPNIVEINLPKNLKNINTKAFCHGKYKNYITDHTLLYALLDTFPVSTANEIMRNVRAIDESILKYDEDNIYNIKQYRFKNDIDLCEFTISSGISSIGFGAFYGCSNLSSCIFPDSIINIGDLGFKDCYSLSSIILNDGLITIGDCAFYGCRNLTSINIPESVEYIGVNAFSGSNIEKLTISDKQFNKFKNSFLKYYHYKKCIN